MQHDLLLKLYDYHCNLFIDGKINYQLFEQIENEYLKRKHLFIICLN
jgi:hypothetical protein